jgi:alpha-L-fucosidase
MGDNKKPNFKMGVPWQTPASMFDETWSYRSWQDRGDVNLKIKEKIHDLVNIVSMGGNYLLNIGPKADGTVIPFETQVLKGIGAWMTVNGAAIYGTKTSPLITPDWGVITSKPEKLYLHILNYPQDQKLVLSGLDANITKIYPLSDKTLALKWVQKNDALSVHLTNEITVNEYATVIVVEFNGDITYTPNKLLDLNENDLFELTKDNAEKYHSFSGHDYYSTRPTVIKMEWNLLSKSRKKYTMKVRFLPGTFDENLLVIINDKEYIINPDEESNSLNNNMLSKTIQDVELNKNTINKVSLQYKQPKNPHKGLPVKGLKITFE